jgi:hypothetical protein
MSTDHNPAPPGHIDPLELLPRDTVVLAPARLPMTMRPPAGAWGFLVQAAQTRLAGSPAFLLPADPHTPSPACVNAGDLLAGVWLSEAPPADLYHGDVAVRLTAPAHGDPALVDVELLAAGNGAWHVHDSWTSLNERWPDIIALATYSLMSDNISNNYARAIDSKLATISDMIMDCLLGPNRRRLPAPDALAELIDAQLVPVGTRLHCGPHHATVARGGVLTDCVPAPNPLTAISTLSSRASWLAGCLVNGWYCWCLPDGRLLNDLRAELAASR